MATVNVYLTFNGNCESAFNFYQSVFGGNFNDFNRFGDMPANDYSPRIPNSAIEKIMHVSLPISKETMLMGCDSVDGLGKAWASGNNFALSVSVDSITEADRLFAKLSEDGKIDMPLEHTFWNAYFGMLTDKFGVSWMINADIAPS